MSGATEDLVLAKAAARAAGAAVLRYFGTDLVVQHKSPDQPLTEADLEADALLRAQLTGARPGYGWLSEETADSADRLGRRRVWIVDPIDGTRSFIAGRPEFAVSVGLVEDGDVVLGVVYNPARDELFHAARGAGAFVEVGGTTARLRTGTPLERVAPTMLASRSELAAGDFDGLRDAWTIEPAGSTAYKLALVAWSRGAAFVSRGPKSEWDIAAGVLLIEEAGGVVTDTEGVRPRFNRADPYVHGIVAARADLHAALLDRLGALAPTGRLRARGQAAHAEEES